MRSREVTLNTVDNIEPFSPPEIQPGVLKLADLRDRFRPSVDTSKASREAAREMASSFRRRVDIPVRKSFVRPMTETSDPVAPLARIYSGGRSGVVAVKLYLALIWRCSAPPFSTDKPARAWATLLDLEDPEGKGARRIKDAMRRLADEQLIDVTSQAGYPNLVTLRDESGSGRAYELPSTSYSFGKANRASKEALAAQTYFKVPLRLWTRGYIQALKGPGLVMLLILLAEQGGEGARVWFSTDEFPRRYNISHKTRAAGTQELRNMGLLTVEREGLPPTSKSGVFETRRTRNVYRLDALAQNTPAEDTAPAKPRKRRRVKRKPTPKA